MFSQFLPQRNRRVHAGLYPARSAEQHPAMTARARIRRRLTLAIVLTALVPMLVALVLARAMVRQTAARFFVPEIGARLDQALGVYQDLAHAVKAAMRSSATAIATRETLARALRAGDRSSMTSELERAVQDNPGVVSLRITDATGRVLAEATRGRPLDPAKEHGLEVIRPIPEDGVTPTGQLTALYATDRARFEELQDMSRFVDTYRQVERRRSSDEISYWYAFALLLGITIVVAAGVAVVLAQSVSSRIAELAAATQRVGEGDLSISVPERGHDEIAELARAFNRMGTHRIPAAHWSLAGDGASAGSRDKEPLDSDTARRAGAAQSLPRRGSGLSPARRQHTRNRTGRGPHPATSGQRIFGFRAAPPRGARSSRSRRVPSRAVRPSPTHR
jgi:two-component system nitrogen regulation sensor histidine kinase NtrY